MLMECFFPFSVFSGIWTTTSCWNSPGLSGHWAGCRSCEIFHFSLFQTAACGRVTYKASLCSTQAFLLLPIHCIKAVFIPSHWWHGSLCQPHSPLASQGLKFHLFSGIFHLMSIPQPGLVLVAVSPVPTSSNVKKVFYISLRINL